MANEKILVVEDEAITGTHIQDILEEVGYTVVGPVMSGEAAINAAASESPDLVLMDIYLQGAMTGIEAAARIWNRHSIPVVFLTAFSDEQTLAQAKLLNPYGYLLKPFEEADLRTAVELALHRRSVEAPKKVLAHELLDPEEDLKTAQLGEKGYTPMTFLKRIDPFRKFPESELEEIASKASFRHLKARQVLGHQGDENKVCFIVVSGRMAFSQASADGKELTVALVPPGDIFGLTLVLHHGPLPFSVTAQRESQILTIPEDALRAALKRHPELYEEFADSLNDRLCRMNSFAVRLAHEKVEARIAFLLEELISVFGKYDRQASSYELNLTRQELAECSGTTPETAIRATKIMERDGLLDLSTPGRIVVLNLDGLSGAKGREQDGDGDAE